MIVRRKIKGIRQAPSTRRVRARSFVWSKSVRRFPFARGFLHGDADASSSSPSHIHQRTHVRTHTQTPPPRRLASTFSTPVDEQPERGSSPTNERTNELRTHGRVRTRRATNFKLGGARPVLSPSRVLSSAVLDAHGTPAVKMILTLVTHFSLTKLHNFYHFQIYHFFLLSTTS